METLRLKSSELVLSDYLKIIIFVLFLAVVFFFNLLVNLHMPLVGEDFSLQPWNYSSTPQTFADKLFALENKVNSQALMWSPRIGEALSIVTAAFPKLVFDILNSFSFIWLIILLYALGYGRFPTPKSYHDLLSLFLLTFLIIFLFPLLGEVFYWKAGATNHLWGTIIILSFLLPFRMHLSNRFALRNWRVVAILSIVGFLAGLAVENSSAASFLLLIFYFLIAINKKKIDWRFIFPILSNAIGVLCLLFSPATLYRRQYYTQFESIYETTGLSLYIGRFIRISKDIILNSWMLLALLIVTIILFLLTNSKLNGLLVLQNKPYKHVLISLFLSGCLSVIVMISISYLSDQKRAFTFFWLILILIVAFLLTEVLWNIPNKWKRIILPILAISLVVEMASIDFIYQKFDLENQSRANLIENALTSGQKDISLPEIAIPISRVLFTRESLSDLGERYATYYGFESVIILRP
jgi:hypothetical protein